MYVSKAILHVAASINCVRIYLVLLYYHRGIRTVGAIYKLLLASINSASKRMPHTMHFHLTTHAHFQSISLPNIHGQTNVILTHHTVLT